MLNGILLSGADADFMIHGIFSYQLFGHTFWITTTHVSIFLISLGLIILAVVTRSKLKPADEVPGTLQSVMEMAVEFVDNLAANNLRGRAPVYRNYMATIFMFILLSNISGLVGLRPPTADYGTTFALGLITFCLIQYNNLKYNKFHAFTDLFKPIPLLFPINLIGEFATPLSLSLRLFGNVVSGTVIMALLYGLLPTAATCWGLPGVLHIYFDLFAGVIQTYVFCMLTMVFIGDKLPDEV